MKKTWKILLGLLLVLLLLGLSGGFWYLNSKKPQRSGEQLLGHLSAPVTVRYDERGVPHISAANEPDLYRALGYVHAQDRLFQMEMVRRLAQGELAAVLGPKMLDVDKLFRTLRLGQHAAKTAASIDRSDPGIQAQLAYLDGINQFQASHPAPIEFDLLGIPKRPFTLADTMAVAGYLAYSFAAAFKTEPVLTYVREQLGAPYLGIFDLPATGANVSHKTNWPALQQFSQAVAQAQQISGVPLYEGSNAWAVSGARSASGKPLLAGDPHIYFSLPSVWYEAHLSAPGFDLYGHFQVLVASAMLGHNRHFGWSLTMFQNDDLDLIKLQTRPQNPNQVAYRGRWVELQNEQETIAVKGQAPVVITLQQAPQGPIINNVFDQLGQQQPIAMWWTFLQTENPLLQAFYQLNRADTLARARHTASQIHAPGLNIVWANAKGDIGWWAAAKLPIRPPGVQPMFILDGSQPESEKLGFYPFADNPQEENPKRGFIASGNQQPKPRHGMTVPGYYNLSARAQFFQQRLSDDSIKWDSRNTQALQLSSQTDYYRQILQPLLPILEQAVQDSDQRFVLARLQKWDGQYSTEDFAPSVFSQFLYQLAQAALADELGPAQFKNLLDTRALDLALPRLAQDPQSPWWDDRQTPAIETRADTVLAAWSASIKHLSATFGAKPQDWAWGRAHTLTHKHPLAVVQPLQWLLNVGPFAMPGGREVPNNMSLTIGPAPWAISYGPSTRRIIDFAQPTQALGINPVGQSGVPFDQHYRDQAEIFAAGQYVREHLDPADVSTHSRSTLLLRPNKP